jgi:ketosteroid isomerase-like protein
MTGRREMADTDTKYDAEVLDAVTGFFEALEDADYAGCLAQFSDDALIWHNYDPVDKPVADVLGQIKASREHIERVQFDVVRRYAVPDGCIQQHVVRGTLEGGATFDIHVVQRICVDDGRITRIEEYLDSGQSPASH